MNHADNCALPAVAGPLITAALLVATSIPLSARQPPGDPWQGGKEYRVSDQAAGTDGYFLVYVPADYDPSEAWPAVFYYHGLGGRPDTRTISRIVNNKYCIVVGMSYHAPGMEGYRFLETEDTRILHHVLARLKARLNVNEKKLYVAGFSKGGFYTCEMLRLLSPELAGAIVLGAGSKSLDAQWPSLTGKEIFIGCGLEDGFLETAKATQKRLAALGATVTFEQWPDVGHSVGDVAGLRKWLFEQTVDRPYVQAPPGGIADPPTPAPTTLPMEARNDPSHGDSPWFACAAVLTALGMGCIAIVMCRRRKPRDATSRSHDGSTEA